MRYGIVVLLLLGAVAESRAQISPGELSSAHSGLEGMGNCTQCHTLGKSIGNEKCLMCHKELQARINARTGYHAGLLSRPCMECHKEHHGSDFSLVRWDKKKFDHSATGFVLEGKHRSLECGQCHAQKNIHAKDVLLNSELVKRGTYLGVTRECVACHKDPHGGALSSACTRCHSSETWKPAPGFSHERTRYPLTGKHVVVRCEGCHARKVNETIRMQFTGIPASRCSDCHGDPHAGRLKKNCDACHNTSGWTAAARGFDHSMTSFPLRGRHGQVRCEQCHTTGVAANVVSGKRGFRIEKYQLCSDCHANPHGSQFATRADRGVCTSCHAEQGWTEKERTGFDHASTRFPLRGKHAQVACATCHVLSKQPRVGIVRVDTKAFNRCADCHADVHGGQFVGRTDGGSCESCHRESGFQPAVFTVDNHSASRFPLTGGHVAVACDRCHTTGIVQGKQVRLFRWPAAVRCESCHKNIHGEQFERWIARGCGSCHTTSTWADMEYDHSLIGFAVTGKHRKVSCAGCHRMGKNVVWQFTGTPKRCADCHKGSVGGRIQ